MLCTKLRFPQPRSRSQSKVKGLLHTNRVSALTQTPIRELNQASVKGKVKQNVKVHRAQNLGSHDQGQGHNRRSKV